LTRNPIAVWLVMEDNLNNPVAAGICLGQTLTHAVGDGHEESHTVHDGICASYTMIPESDYQQNKSTLHGPACGGWAEGSGTRESMSRLTL
jgi:hypothetical protein